MLLFLSFFPGLTVFSIFDSILTRDSVATTAVVAVAVVAVAVVVVVVVAVAATVLIVFLSELDQSHGG